MRAVSVSSTVPAPSRILPPSRAATCSSTWWARGTVNVTSITSTPPATSASATSASSSPLLGADHRHDARCCARGRDSLLWTCGNLRCDSGIDGNGHYECHLLAKQASRLRRHVAAAPCSTRWSGQRKFQPIICAGAMRNAARARASTSWLPGDWQNPRSRFGKSWTRSAGGCIIGVGRGHVGESGEGSGHRSYRAGARMAEFLGSPLANVVFLVALSAVLVAGGIYVIGRVRAGITRQRTPSQRVADEIQRIARQG